MDIKCVNDKYGLKLFKFELCKQNYTKINDSIN